MLNSGDEIEIKSAADLPDMSEIIEIREPWVKGEIILPKSMIGNVLNLIVENVMTQDILIKIITIDMTP